MRGGGPTPHTFPGHLLVCAWSLFCTVVMTSYSANLVANLIAPVPALYPMTDIEEGVLRGLPLCVWSSAAMGPILKDLYPAMVVNDSKSHTLVKKLRAGDCQGAVQNKVHACPFA